MAQNRDIDYRRYVTRAETRPDALDADMQSKWSISDFLLGLTCLLQNFSLPQQPSYLRLR